MKFFQEGKELQGNVDHVGKEWTPDSPPHARGGLLTRAMDSAPGIIRVTGRAIHSGPILANLGHTPGADMLRMSQGEK